MLRVAVARIPEAAGDQGPPGWMGESERSRWGDLPLGKRREFAASRALLRELLSAATGVPAAGWRVSAQPGAVPRACARLGDFAAGVIHVGLSHRLGWVAAAVSDAPVGIDIECDRPSRGFPANAPH